MAIFRLDPIEWIEQHPCWKSTFHRDTCWVQAGSEGQARHRVYAATMQLSEATHGQPLHPSPWLDPTLAKCREERPPFPVPEGVVVGRKGRIIGTLIDASGWRQAAPQARSTTW